MTEQNDQIINPVKIAFIIDGELVDIMYTDERLAAILLSSPKIMDISDYPEDVVFHIGYMYDEQSGSFTPKKTEE